MQYSTQNKLKLMEGTDNVKRQDFVDNFRLIDDGLSKFYVATLDSTNNYKIITGLNKTSLNDGYSIRVAIPSDSTGAVSVIVDSVTVPVKKPNGNAVTNFKANGVYSLTYYNSVFILTSGGGGDEVNFTSDKLLTDYTANNSDGEKVDGTMVNKDNSITSWCGFEQISLQPHPSDSTQGLVTLVPQYGSNLYGYYGANSKITGNIAGLNAGNIKYGVSIGRNNGDSTNTITGEFTGDANATASQILSGYSAYVKGNKIPGGMVNRGAPSVTLNAGGSYSLSAGYYTGGKISANSLASQGAIKMQSGTSISYTEPRSESSSYYNVYIDINPSFTPKAVLVYFPTSMSNSVYTPIVLIGTNLFGTALYQYYDQTSSTLSKHELRSTTGGSLTKYLISCDNSATAYAGKSVSWIALG